MEDRIDVLLVEDNEDQIHFIQRVLDRRRFNVTVITDGRHALNYIRDHDLEFHVILLDYRLPSMNGMEILFKIQELQKELAIIFLTIETGIELVVDAMKHGAMDFMPKTNRFYEGLPSMVEKVYALHRARIEKKHIEQKLMESEKRAAEELRKSLHEKELLLREIHHRVKNNLSLISSLLHFQERLPQSETIRPLLANTRSRIKAMALVHDKLYNNTDLAHINFSDYCRDLARFLFQTFPLPYGRQIEFTLDVEKAVLDIDMLIPCGLIINELVTNSIKHAFPPEIDSPAIHISFHSEDGYYFLKISDNGIGLPEKIDLNPTKTLGLFVLQSLVEQLEGTLDIQRNSGTTFSIRFMIPSLSASPFRK